MNWSLNLKCPAKSRKLIFWAWVILHSLLEPVFIELDDADQEIALAGKQAVDLLAGFMRFMNRFIHFIM